ncbi:MAG: hypothetical protein AVDCRST_MAG36-2662, partial [uncultured Nocardioidaceae bacterium]
APRPHDVLRSLRRPARRRGPRGVRRPAGARATAVLPGLPPPDGRPGDPRRVDGTLRRARRALGQDVGGM